MPLPCFIGNAPVPPFKLSSACWLNDVRVPSKSHLDHLTVCSKSNSKCSWPQASLGSLQISFSLKIPSRTDQVWLLWLDGSPVYLWGSTGNDGELEEARIKNWELIDASPASSLLPITLLYLLFFSLRSSSVYLYFHQAEERKAYLTFWNLCHT